MARPRLDQRPVRQKITLCLRPGEDDDLIRYLAQAREAGIPLAQAVVVAMRGGVETAVGLADDEDDALTDGLLDMVF